MKKALIYSAAVCLASWAVFGAIVLSGGESLTGNVMTVLKSLYMFFPMITALVMQKLSGERMFDRSIVNFRLSPAWLAAALLPIGVLALSILLSALIPGVRLHFGAEQIISMNGMDGEAADALRSQMESISPAVLIADILISGLIAGCTINAVFAFGEEYGWRGYMVHALKGVGFWRAALLIGMVWGIWHAPLILMGHNYAQHPVAGVPMMCVFCILLGVIELYLVRRTGSAVVAAIFHGTVNAISGMALFFLEGGSDLLIGVSGVAGFAATGLVIGLIWLYDRRHGRIMASSL